MLQLAYDNTVTDTDVDPGTHETAIVLETVKDGRVFRRPSSTVPVRDGLTDM